MAQNVINDKIGFIGSGNMAQALCMGFMSSGIIKAEQVIASATGNSPNLCTFKGQGATVTLSNAEVVRNCNVLFMAVKPHQILDVLTEVHHEITDKHLVISIAAGVTLQALQEKLPKGARLVRVMPNTPVHVRCGACVYIPGDHATPDDCTLLETLLGKVGLCEKITERQMAGMIGVAGSGVAYMYIAIEALADGGVKMGLSRAMALRLAAQTVMGAGEMALHSGKHPGQLKDGVCSPGGSTIEAVHTLEKSGFRGALMSAVEAAAEKSSNLG